MSQPSVMKIKMAGPVDRASLRVWLVGWLCLCSAWAMATPRDEFEEGLYQYNAGNFVEAARWYGLAAEQGLAEAQLNLGSMLFQGQGVSRNYEQALFWFIKAAEQGNAEAQTNVGFMYDKAMGVDQDYKRAVFWYRKAAAIGYANAQFNLGMMYYEGLGVIQDYVEAHKWLNIAASNGHPDAMGSREHAEMRMTDTQIAEAQKRASEWYSAFEKGVTDKPMNNLQ